MLDLAFLAVRPGQSLADAHREWRTGDFPDALFDETDRQWPAVVAAVRSVLPAAVEERVEDEREVLDAASGISVGAIGPELGLSPGPRAARLSEQERARVLDVVRAVEAATGRTAVDTGAKGVPVPWRDTVPARPPHEQRRSLWARLLGG